MYGTHAHAQPVAASDGGRPTRTRRRLFIVPVVALTTATMVVLGAGTASATDDPDPAGDLVKKVTKTVNSTVTKSTSTTSSQRSAPVPSRDAPNPPATDDDSPGHETANPTAPDHGSSYVAHVTLGGNDVADVAKGKSTVNDNDSTTADSTLLGLFGMEIIGSHADSKNGPSEDHGAFPKIPLCKSSGGAVCLDLLYSDSYATDNGRSSDASTDNGAANLCVSDTPTPTGGVCNELLSAKLLTSSSSAHRNQSTGRTTAASQSSAADVCVQRDPILGTCTVKADALSSDGQASSDSPRSASRHSQVLNVAIAGNAVPAGPITGTEPFAITIPPPDCPDQSLVCVFGNQGETYLGKDLAGTSQSALDIFALPGTPLELHAELAHSETLVHNDGGTTVLSPPTNHNPSTNPGAHPRPAANLDNNSAADSVNDGVLPHTGGVWSGLLSIGLLLVGAGAMALAWARRRAVLS